jgi:hypothetical protein
MPVGTVTQEPVRYELTSLPPDGFVTLRQLPYWDVLERRDQGSRAVMEQSKRKPGQKADDDTKMVIETYQTWERFYTFKNCIVDHNITDSAGVQLDFNKEMTLRMLNPAVGVEIEKLIDKLNAEDEADEELFPTAASTSSPTQGEKATEVPEPSQLKLSTQTS